MTLPAGTETITVTATYEDFMGNPGTGTVTFTPAANPVSDTTDSVIFCPVPIVATLNGSGQISQSLPTTDQWFPSGWVWQVTENIVFSSKTFTRSYYVALPHTLGSSVNLISIAPMSTAPSVYAYLPTSGGFVDGNVQIDGDLTVTNVASVFPSGDTTGATDVATIQAALNGNAGGTVVLGAGLFYTNAPITIPPFTGLVGQFNSTLVSEGYNGGTTLQPTSGFSSSLGANAVIVLLGQLDASPSYSTSSEEQKIGYLMIDGEHAASGVSGIACYGNAGRVHISNVLISQMTGDGIQQNVDGSSNGPDAWQMDTVNVRYCTGRGYVLRSSDSVYRNCKGSNNCGNGIDADWVIQTTSNSKYIGCSSEHSGAVGFSFVCKNQGTDSGRVLFQGCQTDQSAKHGFEIGGTFNGQTSNANAFPVLLSGCLFGRDGQNGGSGGNYAGVYVNAYGATSGGLVMLSGCHVWPGVNDDGSGVLAPNYGLWIQGESNVAVTGGSYFAATGGTAIFNDATDGANVVTYDSTVATGVGATATMAVNMTPAISSPVVAGITVTPAASPGTDPVFIENVNSGERSFGVRVAGESNDKIKMTSDGVIHLGPGGGTTADTSIQRTSTNTMTLTGNVKVTGSVTQELVAAPVNTKPSAPTGTVSATDVMAGFAVAYTPGSSGNVLVIVTGEVDTATGQTYVNVAGRYGTGTAPANGAASTGTRFGSAADLSPRDTGTAVWSDFAMNDILALTPGTTYWFDLGFSTGNVSDMANLRNVSVSLIELS